MKAPKKYIRSEILEKNMKFKTGFINLIYSKHAEQRFDERISGSLIIKPTIINVSEKNIHSGVSEDGIELADIVVRIEYKKADWCFLAITKSGFVKTVYFQKKGNYYLQKKEDKT